MHQALSLASWLVSTVLGSVPILQMRKGGTERSHTWPGRGGTSCTGLPPEVSSLQASGSPPWRPHNFPVPRASVLPPVFILVFTPLFVSSRQGPYRCGTKPNLQGLPTAAVTNRYKLGNAKQPSSVSSSSGGQKCNVGLTELKSRYWYSLIPSRVSRGRGRICFLLFQLLFFKHFLKILFLYLKETMRGHE